MPIITFNLDDDTEKMLNEMADHDGFEHSRSAFVRVLIRQEHTRRAVRAVDDKHEAELSEVTK